MPSRDAVLVRQTNLSAPIRDRGQRQFSRVCFCLAKAHNLPTVMRLISFFVVGISVYHSTRAAWYVVKRCKRETPAVFCVGVWAV
jgi:hypothetical protein